MSEKIDYLINCGHFEHYISLGHCCYVGIELEKMGLRDSSLPFDWVRTRWKAIDYSMNNNFDNYLDYESLYQKKTALHVYKNLTTALVFFMILLTINHYQHKLKTFKISITEELNAFFLILASLHYLSDICGIMMNWSILQIIMNQLKK